MFDSNFQLNFASNLILFAALNSYSSNVISLHGPTGSYDKVQISLCLSGLAIYLCIPS